MQLTVQGLRDDGYDVRVEHHRCVALYNTRDFHGSLMADTVMTRREFAEYAEEDFDARDFCHVVMPKGGFTFVTVTDTNGDTYTGKHNFNRNKRYEKKVGVTAALGKAMTKRAQDKGESHIALKDYVQNMLTEIHNS